MGVLEKIPEMDKIVKVKEILISCPKCVDRDGRTVPLIIIGEGWPCQVVPDRKCSICGIIYQFEE